jgi:hypothetical protein
VVGGDKTDVRSRIAHAGNHALFGKGTRGHGIAALRRLRGPFHCLLRGGGERLLAMPPTNSALLGYICASLMATTFALRAMPKTHSTPDGTVCAPLVDAAFLHCAMRIMPPTNSVLLGYICASLVATTFPLCAMPKTHSTPDGTVFAPLKAAAFLHCTMPDTNSSLLGRVGATIVATTFHLCAMSHTSPALNGSIDASLVAAAAAFHFPARCSDHRFLSRLPVVSKKSQKVKRVPHRMKRRTDAAPPPETQRNDDGPDKIR